MMLLSALLIVAGVTVFRVRLRLEPKKRPTEDSCGLVCFAFRDGAHQGATNSGAISDQ
jgi:hypothetical protein